MECSVGGIVRIQQQAVGSGKRAVGTHELHVTIVGGGGHLGLSLGAVVDGHVIEHGVSDVSRSYSGYTGLHGAELQLGELELPVVG